VVEEIEDNEDTEGTSEDDDEDDTQDDDEDEDSSESESDGEYSEDGRNEGDRSELGFRRRRAKLMFNTLFLSYDLIKDIAEKDKGMILTENEETDWDVIWYDAYITPNLLIRMHSY
jgi:hypothetical protein